MDIKTRLIVLRDGHWTIECYPEEEAEPIGSPWWFSNVDGFVKMISQEAARKERERVVAIFMQQMVVTGVLEHLEQYDMFRKKLVDSLESAILTPESASQPRTCETCKAVDGLMENNAYCIDCDARASPRPVSAEDVEALREFVYVGTCTRTHLMEIRAKQALDRIAGSLH